jgi:hypothetical protein
MSDLVDELIFRLEENHKSTCTELEMLNYVDAHLDIWKIGLPDDLFLDDIIAEVYHILKRRTKATVTDKSDDIVFKVDEAEQEKQQLSTVVKQYDSLYRQACKIETADRPEDLGEDLDPDPCKEQEVCKEQEAWKDILNKIDLLHSRL